MKHVITDPSECNIKPSDIDTSVPFVHAFFDDRETEDTARYIVGHCQTKGGWFPMTEKELLKEGQPYFHWSGLSSGGWINEGEDDLFRVTSEFVARCYDAAPAIHPSRVEEEHANTR